MNNQAKDENPNKQEATTWIAYNLQEWPRIWTKDKQLKKKPAGGLEPRPARG